MSATRACRTLGCRNLYSYTLGKIDRSSAQRSLTLGEDICSLATTGRDKLAVVTRLTSLTSCVWLGRRPETAECATYGRIHAIHETCDTTGRSRDTLEDSDYYTNLSRYSRSAAHTYVGYSVG